MSETSTGHSEKNLGPASREGKNVFGRVSLYVREVTSELKRVVYPSAEETRRYTIIVIVFVVVITLAVTLLDVGFGRLATFVFGREIAA